MDLRNTHRYLGVPIMTKASKVTTYNSEFETARTGTEQIMDLRNTLRYLGVPIMSKAYIFGDNKSVIMSATIPQSMLNKDTTCCHTTE